MRLAITGGASGIGAETISLLQSAGHELVVFDFHEPAADVTYIPLDLMNGDGIETAVAKADGTFDGLAFIAGIPPRDDNAAACLTV
ncbi:MAG: 3-ketoacyl-ACP reductase, partial [Candidatus Puniceispirillaceae bacterium]